VSSIQPRIPPFTVYWEFNSNPHNLIIEEQMVVLQKQRKVVRK